MTGLKVGCGGRQPTRGVHGLILFSSFQDLNAPRCWLVLNKFTDREAISEKFRSQLFYDVLGIMRSSEDAPAHFSFQRNESPTNAGEPIADIVDVIGKSGGVVEIGVKVLIRSL